MERGQFQGRNFSLVRRKADLLGETRPVILAGWLADEFAAKGGARNSIGFEVPAKQEPTVELQDAA